MKVNKYLQTTSFHVKFQLQFNLSSIQFCRKILYFRRQHISINYWKWTDHYNIQTDYMHIIDTQFNVGLCSFPHSDIDKNTSSLWQTVKWILTDQSSHDALWQQQTTQEDSKTTMWHHRKHQVAITAHDHRGSCQRTCGDTRKQTYSSYSQTHI